jgi:hypothetical protein
VYIFFSQFFSIKNNIQKSIRDRDVSTPTIIFKNETHKIYVYKLPVDVVLELHFSYMGCLKPIDY